MELPTKWGQRGRCQPCPLLAAGALVLLACFRLGSLPCIGLPILPTVPMALARVALSKGNASGYGGSPSYVVGGTTYYTLNTHGH